MFTKPFKKISRNDTAIAGGKGASLGEMIQNGIPVPNGFIVLSGAFDRFLEETDLNAEIDTILHTVDHNTIHTVEDASEQIQSLILNSEISKDIAKEIKKEFKKLDSKFVAVRSSATAEDSSTEAWAGQLDSFLNTTEENLLENVRKCWASLFTPRAIFYRFEKKPHKEIISVAVVVQKMVESESSGIAFSVHPVTEDRNQIIIEAGFGLGEAIVSGSITPDSYVVEKDPRRIIDINVNTQNKKLVRLKNGGNEWIDLTETEGDQQVLTEEQINELTELILKIENHYNTPQDIEWAFQNEKFYIVQSRPITTLTNNIEEKDETINFIKNNKFYKEVVYSFIPVICFESSLKSYIGNPIIEKLNIKKTPKTLAILGKGFQAWSDLNIQKISDKDQIEYVIKECKKSIKKYEEEIIDILNYDYSNLDAKQIIKILKFVDDANKEIYQSYGFLIEEYFETNDKKLIKLFPEVRIEMSELVSGIYDICDLIIKELSERFKELPWQTFTYATFNEIINLLENPTQENIKEFKKIKGQLIGFIFNGNKLVVFREKKEIEKIINILNDQEKTRQKQLKNISEINGFTTFKGKVKGKVIKVSEFDYEKIGKIIKDKKDYILVTPMTRPEFVPVMKKALAVVTDEGGITCHASIISRELKIPCIIGTKIATQVLKDGDLVEVDANEGVVRILRRPRK